MQVGALLSSSSWGTSVWQRIRQLTPLCSAASMISGWLPQIRMVSGSVKLASSKAFGRAMMTLPDTVSVRLEYSLTSLPSSTLIRLNTGRAST